MKNARYFIGSLLAIVALWSCDDLNPDEIPENASAEVRLNALVEKLDSEIPSWDKLYDLAEHVERGEPAQFATQWVQFWGDAPDNLYANIDIWDHYMSDGDATVSAANSYKIGLEYGVLPSGADYPIYNLDVLDKKLRFIGTILLHEKAKGRRTLFQHHYPDGAVDLGFTNAEDFKQYIKEIFGVEKAKEATMAENMQVEYYVPFPEPIESYIERQGFTNGWAKEEKVELAQFVLDEIRDRLGNIFSGILVAPSHAEYESSSDVWHKLDFSEYDEIHFSLVPKCESGVTPEGYMEDQFANINEVLAKHPNMRWGVSQLALYQPAMGGCESGDFADYQQEILNDIFEQLNELEKTYAKHVFSGVFADFLQGGNVTDVKAYWDKK